jgi:hypothetical protein
MATRSASFLVQRSVITLPVMSAEASEVRKAMTLATSSGAAMWMRVWLAATESRTELVRRSAWWTRSQVRTD